MDQIVSQGEDYLTESKIFIDTGKATKDKKPKDVKPYNVESRRTIDAELNERAISFMEESVKNRV